MLGILLFIVAILGSIMIHEWGHYRTARWAGMKVQEFFIGFGPKVWSIKRGETEYGFKALPLGGYVKIAGMNPYEEVPEEDLDRVYRSKAPWKRAIVLVAGSTMHFVIAIVVLFGILAFAGIRGEATTVVEVVALDSPAAAAGFEVGDVVERIDGLPVTSWESLVTEVRNRPGERVTIDVLRDGSQVTLTPLLGARADDQVVQDDDPRTTGFLGIAPEVERVRESIPVAAARSFGEVGRGIVQSFKAFVGLFSPESIGRLIEVATGERERSLEDPASLVGIGKVSADLVRDRDWVTFFSLVAAFNIFIGVANLMPLPPLDGGHLAVLAYEKLRGRDVDMAKLIPVTMTVVLVLGSLFMLLLYLDIANPLPKFPS